MKPSVTRMRRMASERSRLKDPVAASDQRHGADEKQWRPTVCLRD